MAKFLNTSATNFFLEELIKNAKERLILISPYLRLNDRIKELLEDKDRLKIDIRIVYGKSDLHPLTIKSIHYFFEIMDAFSKLNQLKPPNRLNYLSALTILYGLQNAF